ncbi:MAG: cytochrome c biogenesis protein CcsA [Clostridia bacterium]|nr:cytochrome c biogenesis protein CcsA [Clostridia bacterium]
MTGTLLRFVCLAAALFYYAAFATTYFKKKYAKLSLILWCVGIALNAAIVINNWIVNGYMPFVSMYQVLTFLGVTFALVYVYIRYMHEGAFMKRYFIASQGVIMTGVFFMAQASEWTFPPALQSAFFIPHVFSYMISYCLVVVAAILTVISFFLTKKKETYLQYQKGAYNLILTGFPFMVLGMFLGALWANECWGNYWQWDNKEVWSLVTVLMLSIYLHFRRQEKLKKFAPYFILLAFIFEIITLFFVGMFGGDSMHTYN